MKKYIPLLSLLMFMNAQAQECFYAKFLSGANFLQNTTIDDNKASYEPGYIIEGAVGYVLPYDLRIEGEYAYRRNSISQIQFFGQGSSKSGTFQSSSVMANLLWECSYWDLRPFVGAGLGYGWQEMRSTNSLVNFRQDWNRFSWQVMTGLAYPIFCNTDITLEYKFHQGGSHFNNHSIGVGLLYKFSPL